MLQAHRTLPTRPFAAAPALGNLDAMSKSADKSVGHFLVLAARLHRLRAAQHLSAIGLFPGQETVLQLLSQHRELAMGDLAQALQVRPPTASKTVARLTAQGLVTRAAGETDGRVVKVTLTDAGRSLTEELERISAQLEAELVADLDSKDRKRMRKLMRKAARSLSRVAGTSHTEDDDADLDKDDPDLI
jgi:DNA-binding MarR family transcriptional regulator